MPWLPAWAPNVHPFVVHFPIALLLTAVLADAIAMARPGSAWLRRTAVALFVLGAAAALTAMLTGLSAAREQRLAPAAYAVLNEHEEWGERTVWFYGILALGRLAVEWRGWHARRALRLLLFLAGAAGLFSVYETGDHGAQMVYQFGVGVLAAPGTGAARAPGVAAPESGAATTHVGAAALGPAPAAGGSGVRLGAPTSGPRLGTDGGWSWEVTPSDTSVLAQRFEWLEGNAEALRSGLAPEARGASALALQAGGERSLCVFGPPLADLQSGLRLDLDSFHGTAGLVQRARDPRDYDLLACRDGELVLGRVTDGRLQILARAPRLPSGWIDLRFVSTGSHLRGYVGDKMLVHAHGAPPGPGRAGLFVEGTGRLLLARLEAQPLQ